MSTLNGVKYTEKFLTNEELRVIEAMRNVNNGCLKCEGVSDIEIEGFLIGVEFDKLLVQKENDHMLVQISYCPFCGKKL